MEHRILVVEDQRDIAELVRMHIRDLGHQVDLAQDGDEGLERARTGRYDLIVLDVMLPDINGKEVCQRVRTDPTMDDVKIICISGMVEQDKIEDLRASGADDFMQKPFEVDLLVDRICQLLEIETSLVAG